MTYNSGPDGGHNKKMMLPLNLFKEEYSLPNQLPPENSSAITLDEVRYLQSIKVDRKFVEKYDKIKKVFKEALLELELPYIEEEIVPLLKESGKFVMELKYKYNRPRPHQIAEFYGIELNGINMKSMKTPSYPSGHAVQGYIVGMHFAKRYPEHSKLFKQIGEDIAQSRLIAKAHYPSDKTFGKKVAEYLFTLLKQRFYENTAS